MATATKTETPTKHANLAAALVAFQAEIPTVTKSGDSHHGKYATLDAVAEAVYPVLSKHGLAFTAPTGFEGEHFGVLGKLLHESGEEIGGVFPIAPNAAPQAMGSAITYGRRYLLTALTGIAPVGEDDDGNKAQDAAQQREAQATRSQDLQNRADAQRGKEQDANELKVKIVAVLDARGDLEGLEGDAKKKKVTDLGNEFFPRPGWNNDPIALKRWLDDLEKGEVK